MMEFALYIINDIQESVEQMKRHIKAMAAQERKYLKEAILCLRNYHTKLAKPFAKPVSKQLRHHINKRNRTWNKIKLSAHAPALNIILIVAIFC